MASPPAVCHAKRRRDRDDRGSRIADISYGRTTVARVQQQIADAIRNDPSGVYIERFSRLSTPEGIQPFANDYFEDVLALFQRPDGSINTRLVDMFFDSNGVYKGWAREELLTAPDEVLAFDRVTPRDLRTIPDNERPMVMMPELEGEQYIPYANTLPSLLSANGLSDRAYMWMGRQNARLSREPIFWGNVIALWRSAKPRRDQLARAISSARGECGTSWTTRRNLPTTRSRPSWWVRTSLTARTACRWRSWITP